MVEEAVRILKAKAGGHEDLQSHLRLFLLTFVPAAGLLQLAAFYFGTIKFWSGFAGDF